MAVFPLFAISIHALREEGDLTVRSPLGLFLNFYPRPPRGGRHHALVVVLRVDQISIHALREEGDPTPSTDATLSALFLSTPSARRATNLRRRGGRPQYHFYPRPPRGGRRKDNTQAGYFLRISIHALREEGDAAAVIVRLAQRIFLSTPSARRATRGVFNGGYSARNFYPRPPRGGRRWFLAAAAHTDQFLSTPSARRATQEKQGKRLETLISIHALREEGDRKGKAGCRPRGNFYPRPPRGGRLSFDDEDDNTPEFLSTPSARRATSLTAFAMSFILISIHALREEGDSPVQPRRMVGRIFLSTPSARRATTSYNRLSAA